MPLNSISRKPSFYGFKSAVLILLLIVMLCCCNKEKDELNSSNKQEFTSIDGMVYIAAGNTTIGSTDGMLQETPPFNKRIEAFYLDIAPVTVSQFKVFVKETKYITEAERFGNSSVFDFQKQQWVLLDGANWRFPLADTTTAAIDNHPVTHISLSDAKAYLSWAGKRLPTEFEWEHAAKLALNSPHRFSWGDSLNTVTGYKANTWTGTFPTNNTADDGFLLTSPIGFYGSNELGLMDMGGNVWEWTSSVYEAYPNANEKLVRKIKMAPTAYTLKGGSFMCHESYCEGYRVSGRSHTTAESSLFHLGFRGAKDVPN
jgi:sulfatase modifying factor 1